VSFIAVSRRILSEIDSQTKDLLVKELARVLLQFEMENWQMERVHFREHYEKEITFRCRKRLGQLENTSRRT
jgi:hypothetical protein